MKSFLTRLLDFNFGMDVPLNRLPEFFPHNSIISNFADYHTHDLTCSFSPYELRVLFGYMHPNRICDPFQIWRVDE